MKDNPLVGKACEILGAKIEDRTAEEADSTILEKIKEDFTCKEAEAYRGPWEIADIRHKKDAYWIYAWNEKLKSIWVLEIHGEYPIELNKAKKITILSGQIQKYAKPMKGEDFLFRQRIIFAEKPVFGFDEKRAFALW
ncbi:MAG: hypothetical protein ACFFDW_15950 [Candidatus Thorarchaeota archaeon]